MFLHFQTNYEKNGRKFPEISSKRLSPAIGVSTRLRGYKNSPKINCIPTIYFTKVQDQQLGDYATRRDFCFHLLNSDIEQYEFFKSILWTEKVIVINWISAPAGSELNISIVIGGKHQLMLHIHIFKNWNQF